MNTTTRLALAFGLVLGFMQFGATAQVAGFFRLVSTQQTHVVSLDAAGLLVWSNAVPGAPCQILMVS